MGIVLIILKNLYFRCFVTLLGLNYFYEGFICVCVPFNLLLGMYVISSVRFLWFGVVLCCYS